MSRGFWELLLLLFNSAVRPAETGERSCRGDFPDESLGIMQTLRPVLGRESPALTGLSDTKLLVEVFRQGLSRHGADRGCGLKGSAAKAMKYRADLDVRLPTIRVLLSPGSGGYQLNTAYCFERLPLIWGTHICFTFKTNLPGKE
jgi:hypothetical protein